ncbi:MAG: hypothetical protein GWP59_05155 [Chlamydiales bacterium]|nr:hypothetical protein [Chlamydiales bacterium]NCF71073.1 hypothetical protein [Chlamydiales bacterium]
MYLSKNSLQTIPVGTRDADIYYRISDAKHALDFKELKGLLIRGDRALNLLEEESIGKIAALRLERGTVK